MRLAVTTLGEGAPVVLLHGLLGAGQNFGTVQKALAAEGFRVLALDLRNHGASPHAAGMAYPDMAADVAETMAAEGAWPAAVIGHSMGGKVAMALALTRPEGVSRLMVADIAPVPYPAPLFNAYIAAMRGLDLRPGLARREADAALAPAMPAAPLRAFLLQNLDFAQEPPAWRIGLEAIAAGMPAIAGWPDLPGRYEGPVLVLAGERSDYIQPGHRPLFQRLFPAARQGSIPAGHWLHAENPTAFLAQVRGFLAA
ncbi:alpha/beta fold hydrolase [Falsiroseomonas selenitidurans]|uniref:Alpha/beta fold hydrolase n=1 Tax=Falsiroseomonas selenitidurans TaxID=2716335 RepID=A0ABX1E0P0_9PROT|nr:alpha/beta fold hydrolase [Falsiroseomonas selenitidurans]NKC30671.1 alpha/beta fold hydrolase [Falsiroseomonas selenitidurans]